MNMIQLVRQNVWLRRLAASAVAVTVAFGPLQASAQRAAEFGAPPDAGAPNTSVGVAAAIDPATLERAQKKLRDAVAIADHFVPEATAAGLGDSWRMTMITNLMKGSQANFTNVAGSKTLADARLSAIEVAAAGVPASADRSKALGSVTTDLVFMPISPCRIIDTTVTGTPMTSGEQRNFVTLNNASQGASNGSCVFQQVGTALNSKRPAALAANISVLALTTPFSSIGYLAAYPQGGTPDTAFMTYKFNDVISNAGVIPVSQAASNAGFTLFVSFGAHIKMDVFGVFVSPEATALQCVDVVVSDVVAAGNRGLGTASCAAGYTLTGGGIRTFSNDLQTVNASAPSSPNSNSWFSSITNNGAASKTYDTYARCCRTPGR